MTMVKNIHHGSKYLIPDLSGWWGIMLVLPVVQDRYRSSIIKTGLCGSQYPRNGKKKTMTCNLKPGYRVIVSLALWLPLTERLILGWVVVLRLSGERRNLKGDNPLHCLMVKTSTDGRQWAQRTNGWLKMVY